jgi:hypothetical protein
MGIVVRVAHLAFDAADVVTESPKCTANELTCVRKSLMLQALSAVVFLGGRRTISLSPILSEDVVDLGIGTLGSALVVLGELSKLIGRVFEFRLGLGWPHVGADKSICVQTVRLRNIGTSWHPDAGEKCVRILWLGGR